MVFKGGYGRFSARVQVKSGALTILPSLLWAAISSILTISVYYILLILTRDNSDSLPICFQTSVFGLLYIYTIIDIAVVFIILLSRINFIRFQEIASNRWNLMTSMGVPITRLVGRKILSSVIALVRQYGLGFLMVIACGFAFKLPFSANYLVALFFIGSILLILICIIAMTFAIFTKKIATARFMTVLSFCIVEFMMVYFQIYQKNMFRSEIMVGLFKLDELSFLVYCALLFIFCYTTILLRAAKRVRYQELMPLDIYDIRPMISGDETELFTTSGIHHTTIYDTESLQSSPDYRVPAEKPRTVRYEEGSRGYQYKLLLALSSVFCVFSLLLLWVSYLDSNLILERLLGKTVCDILHMSNSKLLLMGLSGVFFILIILFSILNIVSKRRQNANRENEL